MHKRSVFFGVGIGILVMVAIAFGTYMVQLATHASETARLVALLEEQGHIIPDGVDSDYVLARARELGMVFPAEVEMITVVEHPATHDEQYVCDTESLGEPNMDEELELTPAPVPRNYIRMTISAGISATHAVPYFEASGLVADAEDFLEFLISGGYQHSIRAGCFIYPRVPIIMRL